MVVSTVAGVIVPVLFVAYYTWIAKWWRNPTGRSLVALDLCILMIRFPRSVELLHDPSREVFGPTDWVIVAASVAIPLVILSRMLAFEKMRRRAKRRPLAGAWAVASPRAMAPQCQGPRSDRPSAP